MLMSLEKLDFTHEVTMLYTQKEALEKLVLELSLENSKLKQQCMENSIVQEDLFGDFIARWLESRQISLRETTYASYDSQVNKHIVGYFNSRHITLQCLKALDLQEFYAVKLQEGLHPNTVNKLHAIIHKSLDYAMKSDMVQVNQADKVEKPKGIKYNAQHLSTEELSVLYTMLKDTTIITPVLLAGIMGLRRSEALGLRWQDIDIENRTLCINHTVVKVLKNHHVELIFRDSVKTESSKRTLPIPTKLIEHLSNVRKQQMQFYTKNRNSYCKDYLQYVCVNPFGKLLSPDYVTNTFNRILSKKGMRKVRFHDLRHSCASSLLAMGYSLKDIQEWLGHSNIGTTGNFYAHVEYKQKVSMADSINKCLTF